MSLIADDASDGTQPSEDLSVDRIWSLCSRRPLLTLAVPLVFAVAIGVFFSLFGSFTARSRFTPQQQQGNLSALAGLASQFGLSGIAPTLSGGQSVAFYEELLKSPQLLSRLAETEYAFVPTGRADTVRGNLYQFYGVKGRTPDKRVSNMVERLATRIQVSSNVRASVVSVSVKAPFPELAKQVNRRALELVSEFNLRTLQSAATEERKFTEQRLAAARVDLFDAEQAMQRFLERNRMYQSSPELVFEAARLQRRLDLQQQVFLTLSQSYEQARIAEVRNTPVITIVDPPELTATRSRSPLAMAIAAFMVAFVGAVAGVLALEHLKQRMAAER